MKRRTSTELERGGDKRGNHRVSSSSDTSLDSFTPGSSYHTDTEPEEMDEELKKFLTHMKAALADKEISAMFHKPANDLTEKLTEKTQPKD